MQGTVIQKAFMRVSIGHFPNHQASLWCKDNVYVKASEACMVMREIALGKTHISAIKY